MSHTPHELHDEFPDDAALLHDLKISDSHFKTVAERYHEVNREIHRIEVEVDHASDARLEDLKKQRLSMLDEVSQIISRVKAAA
jgi:uncharacterized protein YdcH (DUF465 family)